MIAKTIKPLQIATDIILPLPLKNQMIKEMPDSPLQPLSAHAAAIVVANPLARVCISHIDLHRIVLADMLLAEYSLASGTVNNTDSTTASSRHDVATFAPIYTDTHPHAPAS